MTIVRIWSMPSRFTFTIPVIRSMLDIVVGNGKGWADPFSNSHSPAEFTNDINPTTDADSHLDALEFVKGFGSNQLNGVLLDPPYSYNQVTVSYAGYGSKKQKLTPIKDEIARIIKPGGICIRFGWCSSGLGINRNFRLEEVILICHGGSHNDTIVTRETKGPESMLLF